MSPILQSLANGSARGYGAFVPLGAAGAYESIASATGTGSSATITFSSIPSTYQHLQVRAILKNTDTRNFDSLLEMTMNGNSGSVYSYHILKGDGATTTAFGGATQTKISYVSYYPFDGKGGVNTMGVVIIDIHDYASTTKNKTVRSFSGWDGNGEGQVMLSSGLFQNTGAITSLTFTNDGAYNWKTTTQFALYGIKGA